MDFREFFRGVTGLCDPYPYQMRLAEDAAAGQWPFFVDVPTGLGKTAAVLAAWLWARLTRPEKTPRRLVYCLPMRTLVEQTFAVASEMSAAAGRFFEVGGLPPVTVHKLMGGDVDEDWEKFPERHAVLVGTQDMLLSRALCRGYATRRSKWPVQFGLLNNDVLWVLDEPQLMGPGVETAAQLHALRATVGCHGCTHTLWMSATLHRARMHTYDLRRWLEVTDKEELPALELDAEDRQVPAVVRRLQARKLLTEAPFGPAARKKEAVDEYLDELAGFLRERGSEADCLLVIMNTVDRAQALFRRLRRLLDDRMELLLIHGRFRPIDRQAVEEKLWKQRERPQLVVTTQCIEAGVDVSAGLLVTELAPWPSLVQRFGRCNRAGELQEAKIVWIDLPGELAAPYEAGELDEARQILRRLEGESVSPEQVGRVSCSPPFRVYPALRRKDLLELFDTTPDLLGDDVDISPFIRDAHEADLFVYYRDFDPGVGPDASERAPRAEELVRVPVSRFRDFAKALVKKARGGAADQRLAYLPWVIDPAGERRRWVPIWQPDRLTPGRCVLLHVRSGGYNPELGWTGEKPGAGAVEPVLPSTGAPYAAIDEHLEADPRSAAGTWVALEDHLRDVVGELDGLLAALASIGLSGFETRALRQAAAWHDVGKAHPAFQAKLCFDLPAGVPEPPQRNAVWAKAPHRRTMLGRRQRQEATKTWGPSADRPFFRHELASALAWLDWAEQTHSMAKYVGDRGGPSFVDLVAYLIAAHHGKVRLSIRSVPGESEPPMLGSRAENLREPVSGTRTGPSRSFCPWRVAWR